MDTSYDCCTDFFVSKRCLFFKIKQWKYNVKILKSAVCQTKFNACIIKNTDEVKCSRQTYGVCMIRPMSDNVMYMLCAECFCVCGRVLYHYNYDNLSSHSQSCSAGRTSHFIPSTPNLIVTAAQHYIQWKKTRYAVCIYFPIDGY